MDGESFIGATFLMLGALAVMFAITVNIAGVPLHGIAPVLAGFLAMVMGLVGLFVRALSSF